MLLLGNSYPTCPERYFTNYLGDCDNCRKNCAECTDLFGYCTKCDPNFYLNEKNSCKSCKDDDEYDEC